MREARLARARHGAAADDRRRRGTVVRCAKRRHEDDRAPRRQRPGDRVDPRHLERLVTGQRRQDARQAPSEHRLAGSRRACEQHVVLARRGELERPSPPLLPSHLGEVGQERLLELVAARRGRERDLLLAAQVRDRLRQMVDRDDVDAGQRRLGSRLGRAEQARQPGAARTLGDGDRAGDGANPAVERELAHARVLEQAGRRQLMRAGEERERDRQVEARPLLAQRGGCEVDRDPVPGGPGQHRVDDAAVHPVLGLLAGAVGEPDDRERRQVGRDEVRLDLDLARLEADDGGGEGACEHAIDATVENVCPCLCRALRPKQCDTGPESELPAALSARRRRGSTRSTRRHAGRCGGSRAARAGRRAAARPAAGSPGRDRGGR